MTAFDPVEARKAYAEMDTEELVRIAYLEPDYLPEAKALATNELDRRGVANERDDLISQVRAEMKDRQTAVERSTYANIDRARELQQRFATAVLVFGLWVFALIAPSQVKDWKTAPDWVSIVLSLVWVVAVVDAIKKMKRGKRRQIYLVLVVPAILLLLGLAIRWAI